MEEKCLSLGTETIGNLGGRATELDGLIATSFAPKTLSQVEEEVTTYVQKLAKPSMTNEVVAKLLAVMRDQAAQAIDEFKAVEMWIHCSTPEVSDGNNFGVDVQVYVLEQLKKLRDECTPMLDAPAAYHAARGASLEKLVPSKTAEQSSEEEKKAGGKDGESKTTSVKTSTKESSKPEPLVDYVKHLTAIDTKEYHACYVRLNDIRNAYIRANLLMSRNKKKLADPRGDGGGSRSNAMSMF